MIKLQFLGTSAGSPSLTRNVTALALQLQGQTNWMLVDCGEGTQQQVLRSCFSLAKLSHIFITHMHGDHTLGLAGLLSTRSLLGEKAPLTLYGPAGVRQLVENVLAWTFSRLCYPLTIIELEPTGGTYSLPDLQITAIPLHHGVPSYAYALRLTNMKRPFLADKALAAGIPPGPWYKKLQQGETICLPKGTTLSKETTFVGDDFLGPAPKPLQWVIGGDNAEPSLLLDILQDSQLLVHEGTYTEFDFQNLARRHLHSRMEAVIAIAQAAALPSVILTHFSPRYHRWPSGLDLSTLDKKALQGYNGKIFYAEDLATYCLKHSGELIATSPTSQQ